MILGKNAILEEIANGNIIIDPFSLSQLGPNSYDVRLDRFFYNLVWISGQPWYVYKTSMEEIELDGGTVLGKTMEKVGTHGNIVASMRARSSVGRMGITVCRDAGLGDAGYDNYWTMELTGYSSTGNPVVRYGQRVAQMVFYRVEDPGEYDGQYTTSKWPECMVPARWRSNIVLSIDDIPKE